MINMESLRRSIEAAPDSGLALLPISKLSLQELERELSAGRAAQAELARQAGIAAVIHSIENGTRV